MIGDDMKVSGMYYQVIGYADTLCSSYQILCHNCMSVTHFCFQCSHTYDESIASSNNSYANREVTEYVLYEGAHKLLQKIMVLAMSSDSEFLQMAYGMFSPLLTIFKNNLVTTHL